MIIIIIIVLIMIIIIIITIVIMIITIIIMIIMIIRLVNWSACKASADSLTEWSSLIHTQEVVPCVSFILKKKRKSRRDE